MTDHNSAETKGFSTSRHPPSSTTSTERPRIRSSLGRSPCIQALEMKSQAQQEALDVCVHLEIVFRVIQMHVAVPKSGRKQIAKAVTDSAENAPGQIRACAEAAGIAEHSGVPAFIELIAQFRAENGIGPRSGTLRGCGWRRAAPEIQLIMDVPDPRAREE